MEGSPHFRARADALDVNVVVVAVGPGPRERHILAIWCERRRDLRAVQRRQRHQLRGGELRRDLPALCKIRGGDDGRHQ